MPIKLTCSCVLVLAILLTGCLYEPYPRVDCISEIYSDLPQCVRDTFESLHPDVQISHAESTHFKGKIIDYSIVYTDQRNGQFQSVITPKGEEISVRPFKQSCDSDECTCKQTCTSTVE